MGRLRKPDPSVMTPEDYKKFSKLYEAGKGKEEIKAALDKANVAQAAKEAAYKPTIPKVDYGRRTAPTILEPEEAKQGKATGEPVTYYKLPGGGTTTTKPAPAKGWQVMVDTIITAFNPFSEDKIIATMGGKTFRSVAEFVANHPYITALAGALGVTGIRGLLGKAAITPVREGALRTITMRTPIGYSGGKAIYGTASTYIANTATTKLTGNMLTKAGFSLVSASVILGAIGSYPFARFELVEAMDKIGIARWKAFEAGDTDSMDALNALQKEILNPTGWEKIMRQIPYANVWESVGQNLKAAEANMKVFDKLIEDEQIAKDNGEDEDTKWKRIKQEEADQEKEAVDYASNSFRQDTDYMNAANAAAKEAEREEDKRFYEKQAKFWAEQRELERKKEAEDRRAIAEFWIAYRKQAKKIADDSRPSQLNFGLL